VLRQRTHLPEYRPGRWQTPIPVGYYRAVPPPGGQCLSREAPYPADRVGARKNSWL